MHNAPCSCLGHHQKNYLTGGQKFRSAPKALFSLFVPNSDGLHFWAAPGWIFLRLYVCDRQCSLLCRTKVGIQGPEGLLSYTQHITWSSEWWAPDTYCTQHCSDHGTRVRPILRRLPSRLSGGCSQPVVWVPRVQGTYLLVTPLPIGKAIGLLWVLSPSVTP